MIGRPAGGHRPRRPGAGRSLPHGGGEKTAFAVACRLATVVSIVAVVVAALLIQTYAAPGARRLFRAGVADRPSAAGSVDGAGCGAGWGLSRRAEGKPPAGKPGGLRLGGRELLRRNGLQTDKLNGRLLQRDAEVALRPIVDIDDVLIERAFALHEYRQILRMGLRVVVQREAAV